MIFWSLKSTDFIFPTVDLMMTALMDSGDRQIVYNACGMLINMSGDNEKRSPLVAERIILK